MYFKGALLVNPFCYHYIYAIYYTDKCDSYANIIQKNLTIGSIHIDKNIKKIPSPFLWAYLSLLNIG